MSKKRTRWRVAATVLAIAWNGVVHAEGAATASSPAGLPALTEYTIHVMPQSHMDPVWRWRLYEGRDFIRDTCAQAVRFIKERPDFYFNQSSAWMFEMIEQTDPNLFADIAQAVKDGRWCMVGGAWIEPDDNLPGGEAMVRQFLYGQRYLRDKFGVTATVGWNVDSFGHAWSLPQIMSKAGLKYNVITRCGPGDLMFNWTAPDGSSVICMDVRVLIDEAQKTFNGIKSAWEVVKIMPLLREMLAKIGLKELCAGTAVGDHGGGPTRMEMGIIDTLAKMKGMPKIVLNRADRAMEAMAGSATNLSTWRDELNYIYEGCYTSQMEVKRRNRMNEHWLTTAEKACSMAVLADSPDYAYPAQPLKQAWKDLLFNQFHDILPGTSIHRAYEDVDTIYDRVESVLQDSTEAALAKLAAGADTEGVGQPLLVFNPLSWQRSDLAWVILDYDVVPASVRVRDAAGRVAPGQVVAHQKIYESFERCKIVFIAKDVPPVGYGVYWLEGLNRSEQPLRVLDHFSVPITEELYKAYREKGTYWDQAKPRSTQPTATLAAAEATLENDLYRLRFDKTTGHVTGLTDKRSHRELIPDSQAANRLELMEEKGGGGDAWTLHLTGKATPLDRADSVSVEANGPVLATMLVRYTHEHSLFEQRVTLYHGLDRVDMTNQTEWRQRGQTLKVRWPLAVSTDHAAWEIPYAWIRKPATGREVPAQRWMDVSAADYGVSMLNDGRYGHDCRRETNGNTIGITLLRSSISPDPVADVGLHAVTYSLWPHAGTWDPAQTVRRAEELNAPLMTRAVAAHPGKSRKQSLLQVDSATAIVSAVKPAYDGDGWVVRVWEPSGRGGSVGITFHRPIKSAEETDLLEDRVGSANLEGTVLKFELRPHEIKTFRVKL